VDDRYTVCSPPGAGGVHVVLLLGEGVESFLRRRFRPARTGRFPERRGLFYGWILDRGGKDVDEVLVAFSPRDGAAEITFHGGEALKREVTDVIRGEGFVEATLPFFPMPAWKRQVFRAVVDALTEEGVRHFLAYCGGAYEEKLRRLCRLAAAGRKADFRREAEDLMRGWRLRRGFYSPPRVLLAGPPNAGKSTLFNRVVGYERVVVSDMPGTTRDAVEETVSVRGYPVTFVDTEGTRRFRAEEAEPDDHVVWVVDGPEALRGDPEAYGRNLLCRVCNKADRRGRREGPRDVLFMSALCGEGVKEFLDVVYAKLVGKERIEDIRPGFFASMQVETARRACTLLEEGRREEAAAMLKKFFFSDEYVPAYCECT